MAPAIPPRPDESKRKHHKQSRTQHQSSHDATSPIKKTHVRMDSAGSTRGAFYEHSNPILENTGIQYGYNHHARKRKKSPKKTSPPPRNPTGGKPSTLSSNAETMGNMASLAMEGLDQDDFGGFLLDSASPSPLKEHKSARTTDASPKGLDTIMDASGGGAVGDLNYNSGGVSPAAHPRNAYAAARNAQSSSSEQSLDYLTATMKNAIPPPPRGTIPRMESLTMQYSEGSLNTNSATDSNSLNYFPAYGAGGGGTMLGDPFGHASTRTESSIHTSTRTTESGRLFGADIPASSDGIEVSLPPGQQPQYYQQASSSSPYLYGAYYSPRSSITSPGVVPPLSSHQQPHSVSFASGGPTSSIAQQRQEIAKFASLAQQDSDYGTTQNVPSFQPYARGPPLLEHQLSRTLGSELSDDEDDEDYDNDELYSFQEEDAPRTCSERIKKFLDPTYFLLSDVKEYDDQGHPIFDEHSGWTIPALLRHLLYNPEYPEFTSLQQFNWAVILGVIMGMYTAVWKNIIERCVDFVWQTVPETLMRWGVFTDLDGWFPLPNYMWICPAVFGGVLSYIFVVLPTKIPGQNEWIQALHARGVQEHNTFWPLWVLSTLGMTSGLSLGPELPLVLTAGMVGSWLGVISKQSMLQARVMNLTAASAAVGGFFGFPMAGAIFVLEIPHRMGLQYFEALSPATIASIVAVLVNRMIVNNDVTGYYNYPFLTATLPSHIFTTSIVYGLVGCGIGVIYANSVMFLKHLVHDLFNTHGHHGDGDKNEEDTEEHDDDDGSHSDEVKEKTEVNDANGSNRSDETIPLVVHTHAKHREQEEKNIFERIGDISNKALSFGIKHEPTRAAVAGTLAGLVVGVTCMFVPHVTFWGEAQLQTLIDKGRTPLPVFGEEHKSTEDMTAYGFCLIDPKDPNAVAAGFSIGCAALITSAKIFVTGLSLGTGIIGGHFWGPLFVGCAASHLLTDLANLMQSSLGFGESLATYPCVSILCMMGSTHVVTFRAHMAIMLILTLTISAFDGGDSSGTGYTAGDYSAVFPLLVVSVFVSLMISRDTIFYSAQRSRGDIMALPEVLCEPGKEGAPMIIDYGDDEHDYDSFTSSQVVSQQEEYALHSGDDSTSTSDDVRRIRDNKERSEDIEVEFEQKKVNLSKSGSGSSNHIRETSSSSQHQIPEPDVPFLPKEEIDGPPVLPPPSNATATVPHGRSMTVVVDHHEHPAMLNSNRSEEDVVLTVERMEEMLSKPLEPRFRPPKGARHRRIHSAPGGDFTTSEFEVPITTSPTGRYPRHRRLGSTGGGAGTMESVRERSNSASSSRATTPTQAQLMRVNSYGEVSEFQPSLLDQARKRASSMHKRSGSSSSAANKQQSQRMIPRGRHSRQGSNASSVGSAALASFTDSLPVGASSSLTNPLAGSGGAVGLGAADTSGALTEDEQEQIYSQLAPGMKKSIWS